MLAISDVILLMVVCVWCTILVVAQFTDNTNTKAERGELNANTTNTR